MKKSKWFAMAATLLGGATLFSGGSGGCGFSGFTKGLLETGWPSSNRWLNLAIDILNEDLFG